MKKITLFVAALAMVAMSACNSKSNTAEAADGVAKIEADAENVATSTDAAVANVVDEPATDGVVALTDDAKFTPQTKVTVPTVLDFNAVWCVPCKKLTPAFDASAEKFAGKVSFYSVDIDNLKKTAEAFNVQSIPTVVILTPNGAPQTYVGLSDFGIDETVPADAVTETITKNMVEKIEAALK